MTSTWLSLLAFAAACVSIRAAPSFTINNDSFLLDGEAVQLRSCSFHYSRAPPQLWQDRLDRLAAMGCNTIQTYVPWNWHEAEPDEFNFSGDRDLGAFLDLVWKTGLLTIVRAGPYMCGEWEFGGLPSWLIELDPSMQIRTWDATYVDRVERYFAALLPVVKPRLYSAAGSGSVVMVQVENEYGSFGDVSQNPKDKKYLEHLVQLASDAMGNAAVGTHDKVILYTDDGGNTGYMTRGSLNGSAVYTVGDGGPGPDEGLCEAMAAFNPPGMSPCLDDEFYGGWITHWGETVANTSSATVAEYLNATLAEGHSVSIYMAFGGSNFGVFSGANGGGKEYQSTIQSYDYDSPVSEGGEHGYGPDGDKYAAVQRVFGAYAKAPLPAEPPLPPRFAYPSVNLTEVAWLLDPAALLTLAPDGPKVADDLEAGNMEAFGQRYGFILYSATLPAPPAAAAAAAAAAASSQYRTLEIAGYPRDRAQVFVQGSEACAPIFRPEAAPANLTTPSPSGWSGTGGETMQLLVENMARLTYGRDMWDPKGILGAVSIDGENITGPNAWQIHNLEMNYTTVSKLDFEPLAATLADRIGDSKHDGPAFFRGSLEVSEVGDTYLSLRGPRWHRGWVWVNGFALGRYWPDMGPQLTMYVPSVLLTKGENEVVLLELHPADALGHGVFSVLDFVSTQDFSGARAVCRTGGAAAAGTAVDVFECGSSGARQDWSFDGSTGLVQLATASANGVAMCVRLASGANATLAACDGSDPAQAFVYESATGLLKLGSNVAQVAAGSEDGAAVVVGAVPPASQGSLAKWSMADTPAHKLHIVLAEGNRCLSACPN